MAKCNRKTLRGIFGAGRKLGFDIDDLRAMTKTGHLSEVEEPEAARLLHNLRAQQAGNRKNGRLWRLYSSSTLAREICFYRDGIYWRSRPGGFRAWLKKYFGVEQLEWIASFQTAVNVKNALKRMYHHEQKSDAR